MSVVYLLPVNVYGPGGNFDRHSPHVIFASIRKFCEAKEQAKAAVMVWGKGQGSPGFLFIEDCALAAESGSCAAMLFDDRPRRTIESWNYVGHRGEKSGQRGKP